MQFFMNSSCEETKKDQISIDSVMTDKSDKI